ncbi:MAG TPA: aspartate aminotransferase family protein [Trueperaceae bacterium]|nr:aspartate aminotransferase family protein [Trueperaceae bacterium]
MISERTGRTADAKDVANDATRELVERQRAVFYPIVGKLQLYGDEPLAVEHAAGMYLYDIAGNEYLDFFGGILTVSVGHCNQEVTEATIAQLRTVQHTSTLFINEVTIRFAEKLAQLAPGRLSASFFTSSGSEANETAIMTARMYTGRTDIIALRHGYSGRTQTAMSLTGQAPWRSGGVYDGYVKHVRNPYLYRRPRGMSEESFVDLCIDDLEEVIATTTEGRVAAFLAEPVQGVGGFIPAPVDYLRRAAEVVRAAGGLVIIDEVQTGWGRTGKHMFAIEHWGVTPDIMVFAKGVANGYPLGVTLTTPEIAAAVDHNSLATFGGNPVAMATALATVEYIEKHDLVANADEQGARLRARLEASKRRYDFVGDVRGMGLMQALELVVPGEAKKPDAARASAFVAAARRGGLLLGKGGMRGNVIRIAPPLIVDAGEIDRAADIIDAALAEVA